MALAGELSHAGIVALYELARQGDDVGLVMEYLPAADLRASVRDVVEQSIEPAATVGLALNGLREGARYARHAAMLSRSKGAEADTRASVAIVRQMDSRYTRTLEKSTGRLRDTSLGWQELEEELNEGA